MNPAKVHGKIIRMRNRFGMFFSLIVSSVLLLAVFALGILGYMHVEGWTFFDSLYQVIITLSTVGFQEVNPMTAEGRVLTMVLIVGGVGGFAYLIGSFTQVLIEGRIQQIWEKRRVQKTIDRLQNHIIICGFGRIGSVVAREIIREGHAVVVIESKEEVVRELEEKGILHIAGDATADETLLAAGLHRAKSLVTALHQEAANVYVTLTARQLNHTVAIVARADHPSHIARLERAGADQVLIPHLYGGVRMAQSVLRPTVTNFLDMAARGGSVDLQMEELLVRADSEIVNKNLIEAEIRPRFNLIVIGIKKASGDMIFNPQPQSVLEADDTMILVGKKENLDHLREIL